MSRPRRRAAARAARAAAREASSERAVRRVPRVPPTPPTARPRWRGWLLAALAAGLALVGLPWGQYLIAPPEVRQAVVALRDSAVFVAPGSEPAMDAERARQVIGDRPFVVAVLGPSFTGGVLDACRALARLQDRTIVLTYAAGEPGTTPAICQTRGFPEPAGFEENSLGSPVDQWLFRLSLAADRATTVRAPEGQVDRTPDVEELVLQYDRLAARTYPGGAPVRESGADPLTVTVVVVQLAALVGGVGLVFVVLRRLAWRLRGRLIARRQRRERWLELDGELSELAEQVWSFPEATTPQQAERQAAAAERYVLALTVVEDARRDDEVQAAQRELADVRRHVDAGRS